MIPQIQIRQVLGQIGLRYQPQQWNLQSPPDNLSIDAPSADLQIQKTPGNLSIDQTQAFADEGLRTPLAFTEYESAKARQTAEDGTVSTAQWGQRFLHIEKGDPLKAYVSRNVDTPVQAVPALVPSPFSVKVHYEPSQLHISASVQPVRIQAQTSPVAVTLTPAVVRTYLAQSPELSITAPPVGALVDTKV